MAYAVVLQGLLQSRLHAASFVEEPADDAVVLQSLLQSRLHAASLRSGAAEPTAESVARSIFRRGAHREDDVSGCVTAPSTIRDRNNIFLNALNMF